MIVSLEALGTNVYYGYAMHPAGQFRVPKFHSKDDVNLVSPKVCYILMENVFPFAKNTMHILYLRFETFSKLYEIVLYTNLIKSWTNVKLRIYLAATNSKKLQIIH